MHVYVKVQAICMVRRHLQTAPLDREEQDGYGLLVIDGYIIIIIIYYLFIIYSLFIHYLFIIYSL